jgi:hypothetical protein
VSRELKPAWIVVAVASALILTVLALRVEKELRPELRTVRVAIEPAGSGIARVGPVETDAGTAFTLHAVAEAEDWRGKRLYYTEAERLEIGGEEVPSRSLRRWNREDEVRILWFTVEGPRPYVEITDPDRLGELEFREVFQADWPQAWAVPGHLDPAVENFLPGREEYEPPLRFGTQRFHVRIEVFGPSSRILPRIRLRSSGAAELVNDVEDFPAVVAVLPRPLETVSRVFGLTQIEPLGNSRSELVVVLSEWSRRGLVFSRLPLLRSWLESMEALWEELEWIPIEIAGTMEWTGPGHLLRAGSKVVFTYEDRGIVGILDYEDLCFDFDKGATVRTLGEIFTGEGLVEWAAVAR